MFKSLFNRREKKLSDDQIKKLQKTLDEILVRDQRFDAKSDDEIRAHTEQFRRRLADGESLDALLPEAFATVKQACKRMFGQEISLKNQTTRREMVPYDVQLLGGIILHQGMIAEMKTGEGKTLVATLPVYLNALSGHGVHLVTVNDYLASRDAERMGHLYARLGLTTGCVTKSTSLQSRRDEYAKDITYVENSELGFDYLRDYLVKNADQRNLVTRPLNFAIVDEIDSILVDEARTPLIISEPRDEATDKYQSYARLVSQLTPCSTKKKVSKNFLQDFLSDEKKSTEEDGDFYIDEKTKSVQLSSRGIAKLEKILGVEHLYRDLGYDEIHHIENALKAHATYHRDREYIVRDSEVLIVDEHTGRSMPGRRFSDGLHQAIEAKEWVAIKRESKTLATITYQNFFKQYKKLAGMTGTAVTEAEEFAKIYNLEVVSVPTNKPVIRADKSDKVFFNQTAKRNNILETIKFAHSVGQPILLGTSSINTSEHLATILSQNQLPHAVLNAKFHEQEAEIIARAGQPGSIVVATNMAGRGTDIKLAPSINQTLAKNYATRTAKNVEKSDLSIAIFSEFERNLFVPDFQRELGLSDDKIRDAMTRETTRNFKDSKFSLKISFNQKQKTTGESYCEILLKKLGKSDREIREKDFHFGLLILGTEKHDSRRIDNQLRGRAWRQGDAGASVFYVALDDSIMRKIGGEKIQSMAKMLIPADQRETIELTQKQFTSSIARAQKHMEANNFSIRKHLFDYDSVIDVQRQRVYTQKDQLLAAESDPELQAEILAKRRPERHDATREFIDENLTLAEQNPENLTKILDELRLQKSNFDPSTDDPATALLALAETRFAALDALDQSKRFQLTKFVDLQHLDRAWITHLDEMQQLREKVGLMGYAQIDPIVQYKSEAYKKFESFKKIRRRETAITMLQIDLARLDQHEKSTENATENSPKNFSQTPDGKIIIDADDTPTTTKPRKLRPNDSVTVRYPDGRTLTTKFKKIQAQLDAGEVTLT